jgi:hypothetical protein
MKKSSKSSKAAGLVKEGFFVGLGAFGAVILFVLVALAFIIPGILILASERKKSQAERSTGMMVLAYVLLFLGMIIGGGLGGSFVFGNLLSDI